MGKLGVMGVMGLILSHGVLAQNVQKIDIIHDFAGVPWGQSFAALGSVVSNPSIEYRAWEKTGVKYSCYNKKEDYQNFKTKFNHQEKTSLYTYCFKANHLALGVLMSNSKDTYDDILSIHKPLSQYKNETMVWENEETSKWIITDKVNAINSSFYYSKDKNVSVWFINNINVTLDNMTDDEVSHYRSTDIKKASML